MAQRYLIGPYHSGLQTDVSPWLIADDAYADIQNMHLFEGRTVKRLGGIPLNRNVAGANQQLYSRLSVKLGVIDGGGNLPGSPVNLPGNVFKVGQMVSVGNQVWTVTVAGNPATLVGPVAPPNVTVNTVGGTVSVANATPGDDVYWYPHEPVMGLPTFEQNQQNNFEDLYGFDTQFSYQYINGHWERLAAEVAAGYATWTGGNADFFWSLNHRGNNFSQTYFFTTNNVIADGIRFRNATPAWDKLGGALGGPQIDAVPNYMFTAKLLATFKGRLISFNTKEGPNVGGALAYPQRVRWSFIGDPTNAQAWRTDLKNGSGFADIPTREGINSIGFVKDQLVIFCERSTWILGYTGNNKDPFKIKRINTELGIESTFSLALFDRAVIGIGATGIHSCNGVDITRIDNKIEHDVFKIRNATEGIIRTHGIRDYFTELVLWTFPSDQSDHVWPNKVLVYNYKTGAWSVYDDSITTFGYFHLTEDLEWQDIDDEWQNIGYQWNAAITEAQAQVIVAGNQTGYTFLMLEENRNAGALNISAIDFADPTAPIITSFDHNLKNDGDNFLLFEGLTGDNLADMNDVIFKTHQVLDDNRFSVARPAGVAATYRGGGTLTLVSRPFILTKQYNFFQKDYRNCHVPQIDLQLTKTAGGELTYSYMVSSSQVDLLPEAINNGVALGTGTLQTSAYATVPLEATQERVWHTIYPQADGAYFQLGLYLTDAQMLDRNKSLSNIEIHAMMITAKPSSSRLY